MKTTTKFKLKLTTESSVEIIEEKTSIFYTQDESAHPECSFESGFYLQNPETGEKGRWSKGKKKVYVKTTMSVSDGVEIIRDGIKGSAFASYSNGGGTDGYRHSRDIILPRNVVTNYIVKVPGYRRISSIGIGETQNLFKDN